MLTMPTGCAPPRVDDRHVDQGGCVRDRELRTERGFGDVEATASTMSAGAFHDPVAFTLPPARSGQVCDHVVPRPVPSTVTLPAAFSSVSTNRIVLSDTPGTARRMSAIVNWAGACNST